MTEGVKGTLRARARMMGALRRTLEARGFLEVETPVLETSAGGADARPFTTFHNALQQPYVLRIATGIGSTPSSWCNLDLDIIVLRIATGVVQVLARHLVPGAILILKSSVTILGDPDLPECSGQHP